MSRFNPNSVAGWSIVPENSCLKQVPSERSVQGGKVIKEMVSRPRWVIRSFRMV